MAIAVNKAISKVVENGLCTGCGTCVGICPVDAIEMVIERKKGIYIPQLDEEKCNQCGLCFEVCPGHGADFKQLNLGIFGKEPDDVLLGNYINCYVGHATDYDIRYNSASGGLVTALLIFALEQGMIDGALVTRVEKDKPLEPEPFIARTNDEIIEAAKSKYCPVPANIALKEILQRNGKFAVVGLPCHIHGVRKAETVSKGLKERVAFHFGIFCSQMDSFKSTQFLLTKLGIERRAVASIRYCGAGWPGEVKIRLRNGDEKTIPPTSALWASCHCSLLFSPARCLLCNDVTNELADISFGDAWLPEIMATEQEGKSIVIARSAQGEALLHRASSGGIIELQDVDAGDVIRSQKRFLHFKKIDLEGRIQLRGLFKKKSPYGGRRTKTTLYNRLLAIFALANNWLVSRPGFVRMLQHVPTKVLQKYVSAFYLLSSREIQKDFSKLWLGTGGLNILILHAHWNNRGDEAAIRAMIDSLRSELPLKKMSMMIVGSDVNWFPYDDMDVIELYPSSSGGRIRGYLDPLLMLVTFGKLSFSKGGRKFIKAADEADIVIHAPGGPSIGDLYGGRVLGDLPYLHRLIVVTLLKKKPLFFYAPSMGPFSGRLRNFIRKLILKRADMITVRDAISAVYLKEQLGLEACVTLDSALQNDIPDSYLAKYDNLSGILKMLERTKVVGMVVTDLKWHPIHGRSPLLAQKITDCCLSVADYLCNNGYTIFLIPQLFGLSYEKLEAGLLERMNKLNRGQLRICPREIDSYAQQIIISKLFCLITMRYHPAVFAAKENTPFVSIYYEHKAEGFVERAGLTDFMIPIEEVSAEKIIDKFAALEQNYDAVKGRLEAINPSLKEESRKTNRILSDRLAELGWKIK
jgi:coenzyme F420 hydrogenase subunit beta